MREKKGIFWDWYVVMGGFSDLKHQLWSALLL